jgi:hypothetical protein
LTSIPLASNNIRPHKRTISAVALVIIVGAFAASLVTVRGRAAGLGFPWPASIANIVAAPNAPNLGPGDC